MSISSHGLVGRSLWYRWPLEMLLCCVVKIAQKHHTHLHSHISMSIKIYLYSSVTPSVCQFVCLSVCPSICLQNTDPIAMKFSKGIVCALRMVYSLRLGWWVPCVWYGALCKKKVSNVNLLPVALQIMPGALIYHNHAFCFESDRFIARCSAIRFTQRNTPRFIRLWDHIVHHHNKLTPS